MAEAAPLAFACEDEDGAVGIAKVELHRVFETDKDGRTTIHAWVTAEVTPPDDDYVSITADIAFALSYDDTEIGRCGKHGLVFDGDHRDPVAIKADSALRIPLNAEVTSIAVEVDITKVVHVQDKRRFGLVARSSD